MRLAPGILINPTTAGDNMYEPSKPSYPKLAVQFLDLPCDICNSRQGFKQCKYCSKILCKIHSIGEENCFVQLLNQRAEQAKLSGGAEQIKRAKRSSRIKSVGPPPSPEVNQTANTTSQSIINWIKQSANRRTNGM